MRSRSLATLTSLPLLAFVVSLGCGGARVSAMGNEDPRTAGGGGPSGGGGASVALHTHADAPLDLPDDEQIVEPDHPAVQTPQERALVHVHTPKSVCSGAVIGPRLILTAHHCLGDLPGGPVTAAESDKYRVEVASSTLTWTTRGVEQVIFPSCSWEKLDLAVLVLDRPVEWVQPLKVVSAPSPGVRVQALGFGKCPGETRALGARTGEVVTRESDALVIEVPLCRGDVGGPVVQGGLLVGVISHHDDADTSPRHKTTIFRFDTTSARSLIAEAEAAVTSHKSAHAVACE
jgi:hypothetical protein